MSEDVECKTHPDAPHGFVRNASHTQDRLVCECEYWEEPKVNELIRRLLNEATSGLDPDLSKQRTVTLNEMEKFAELIVRECMDIARKVGNISEPDDFALDRCYEIEQRIQDRFGVEE